MLTIQDIRLLLPAIVNFKENDVEQSAFVYIDQIKMDVVIPDMVGINDVDEFKKAFIKYFGFKNPVVKSPKLPKDMLKEFNSKDYKEFNDGK